VEGIAAAHPEADELPRVDAAMMLNSRLFTIEPSD
jgi:hypothetical protein